MAYKIDKIEGIGPVYAAKLSEAGITTTSLLLTECGTPGGRKTVAIKTGLKAEQILKWTNMADLMRISGVGEEYSELLEAAGVDTTKELRNRNPGNLTAHMKQVNTQKKLVRQPPGLTQVTKWVAHAKELPPAISY